MLRTSRRRCAGGLFGLHTPVICEPEKVSRLSLSSRSSYQANTVPDTQSGSCGKERISTHLESNHNRMLNRDQTLLHVSGSMRLLLACLMGVFSLLRWVLPVAFAPRAEAPQNTMTP